MVKGLLEALEEHFVWGVVEIDTRKEKDKEKYISEALSNFESKYEVLNIFESQKYPGVYHIHLKNLGVSENA